MQKKMRLTLLILTAAVLVLSGCSFPLLNRNVPSTGTSTEVAQAETGYPVATATGPSAGTAYPAATATNTLPPVITATSLATVTTAPSATVPPATATNTAVPVNTVPVIPTAAVTQIIPTAGVTQVVPTQGVTQIAGAIPLPANRTAIQFPQGATSYVVTTTLTQNTPQAYQLNVQQGQRMFITIDGSASMQIYAPNLNPISGVLTAINPVQISISQNGNHYIALQGSGPVAMSVYVPAFGGNQTVPAPVPGQLTPIQFATGGTSASFTVNMNPAVPLGYTINALAGQRLTVTTGGNATITLLTPASEMLPSSNAPLHQWIYTLPVSGTYRMIVLGTGSVTVSVHIPAIATVVPTQPGGSLPVPMPGSVTRVSFAPGNASATVNASLTAGQPQGYVLRLLAGQTLYVATTGTVDITIYGPAGNVLTTGSAGYPQRWSAPVATDGDYTFVVRGSGASQLVFYVPPR